MSQVAIIGCKSYEVNEVREAVTRGLGLLGGAERFVKPGQKLLLKPNLLAADPPEKCVTTHPAVFRAVAESFRAAGALLSYGDSPALVNMEAAAKKSGLQAVAKELQLPAADFKSAVEVFHEQGIQNKKFFVAKAVLDNDIVVSLPKLKTHGLEKYTGCVKNQFGCIPGVRKGEYHIKLTNANNFAQMLLDLNSFVKPALYVMDGIQAMEGNGPRGGKVRKMNMLLFSNDPIALDATVCRLINVNPEYVPTVKLGHKAGAGTYLAKEILLVGDDIDNFRQDDFDIDRSELKPFNRKGMVSFMNNWLVPKPYIIAEKCKACGQCISICPTQPKSVNWKGGKKRPPAHNYATCIRCYCCQELCPESAIELKFPLVRRLFVGKSR